MNFLILAVLVHLAQCGIIQEHGIEHHERATSFQNIHIEHFHPVLTYIKKEHKQLLEHPISLGTSSSKVEVHHGDKHDHGYGFATAENNLHGHGLGLEGFGNFEADHGAGAQIDYQVQDHEVGLTQYQGQLGEDGHGLGHYQTSSGLQEYANAAHVQYGHHES